MRLPIAIPPGLRRDGTEGQSRGRWMRSNLVRSYGSDIGPVLGWRERSASTVSGKARAILTWSEEDGTRRIAIGTHSGLYVMTTAGVVHNITPAAFVTGEPDATAFTGYGAGTYGASSYGTPRISTSDPIPATVWTLDTWGQYLVGCSPADGRIFQWTNNTGTPAAVVTNAPADCLGVLTTQDRFTVAMGALDNPRLVMWSDRGDNTDWTPTSINLAGSFELDTNGGFVAAAELRSQTLILTNIDAHAMQYVGLPSVYLFNRIGDGCGALSSGCIATQGDFAMWWSKSGFMRFDGALTPVECPIQDINVSFNTGQRSKISAYHNALYAELVWLYPSAASTENDSYVSFNYQTGEWWQGSLDRLSGIAPGVFEFPLLMSSDGHAYEHEVGGNYDGAVPYARSGPILLGDGSNVMRVSGIVPDTAGTCQVAFYNRDYPMSAQTDISATSLAAGRTDLRFTARQAEIEVSFGTIDGRFGVSFLEATPGGTR